MRFRRPEVGETVLSQRRTSGKHHAVVQSDVTVRPVSGAGGHHIGCIHANGVAVVGLARAGQRARQQGRESYAEQEKST